MQPVKSNVKWRTVGEVKVLVVNLDTKEEAKADRVEVRCGGSTHVLKDRRGYRTRVGV